MADDIGRYGEDPRAEAARRLREGELRRAAERNGMTVDEYRRQRMQLTDPRAASGGGGGYGPPALPPSTGEPMAPRGGGMPSMGGSGNLPATRLRTNFDDMMRRGLAGRPGAPGGGRMAGGAAGAALLLAPILSGVEDALRRRATETMDRRYGSREADTLRRTMPADPAMDRLENTDQMRPPPASAPARQTPARPQPRRRAAPARREMSADDLNRLSMGEEPRNAEEREAQMRMAQRRSELEQSGTAFKKGGMVKPKAAPKKMMKGGMVAKPTVKGKVKPKGKVMPFKKGGNVAMKKGKK